MKFPSWKTTYTGIIKFCVSGALMAAAQPTLDFMLSAGGLQNPIVVPWWLYAISAVKAIAGLIQSVVMADKNPTPPPGAGVDASIVDLPIGESNDEGNDSPFDSESSDGEVGS